MHDELGRFTSYLLNFSFFLSLSLSLHVSSVAYRLEESNFFAAAAAAVVVLAPRVSFVWFTVPFKAPLSFFRSFV